MSSFCSLLLSIIRRSEEWHCSTFTLIRLCKICNGLARTWTLNSPSSSIISSPSTLLGEEPLLSDLNQLTQSPDHDLGRNSSIIFPLVGTCTGSNSILSWNIRINCETYRNFRCTCALFMIMIETAFEIFLLHGLAFHCLALHIVTLHSTAFHCVALHSTVVHCIPLHCITFHCIASIALYCLPSHCIAFHCIALLSTALHWRNQLRVQPSSLELRMEGEV